MSEETGAPSPPTADEKLQHTKLAKEVGKLEQEIERLRSENTVWGTLSRNIWPLLSGLVTLSVSIASLFLSGSALQISKQTQQFNVDQEKEKRFFAALQMATDEKAGQDARTAGIWTLSEHWNDRYSGTVASTLAAILATEPTDSTIPGASTKAQTLRYAAAIVIGTAFQSCDAGECARLTKLLYGDAPNATSGAVTREQQYFSNAKKYYSGKGDPPFESILQVTREAIRYNSRHLESAMFGNDDLSQIDLDNAKAHGAYFGNAKLIGANLCNADLSEATFDGADLSYADLQGADIASSYGWEKGNTNLKGADVRGVKNQTPEFKKVAISTGAVDLPFDQWRRDLARNGYTASQPTSYANCDK
jgi:uncharacterized protein YjbI with pentapeptide repeats